MSMLSVHSAGKNNTHCQGIPHAALSPLQTHMTNGFMEHGVSPRLSLMAVP